MHGPSIRYEHKMVHEMHSDTGSDHEFQLKVFLTKFQGNKLEDAEESEGSQHPNGDTREGRGGFLLRHHLLESAYWFLEEDAASMCSSYKAFSILLLNINS